MSEVTVDSNDVAAQGLDKVPQISKKRSKGLFPVHEAAEENDFAKLRIAINSTRVSIEAYNPDGKTSLYICAEKVAPFYSFEHVISALVN